MRRLGGHFLVLVLALAGGALALYAALKPGQGDSLFWQAPRAFWLLVLVPVLAWQGFSARQRKLPALGFSEIAPLQRVEPGFVGRWSGLPEVLRIVAFCFIVCALARPVSQRELVKTVRGIDIVIALDLSKSMAESDIAPSRLGAGQCTIHHFLEKRTSDRIGLVVFGREAVVQSPLTLDYRLLDSIVRDLVVGAIPSDDTALGDGLGLALALLRRSSSRSQVVILVSDGESTRTNELMPWEAKELAVSQGVRVFTVLMGNPKASSRFDDTYGMDPELLKEIARDTGGRYFNADDQEGLERSFQEIRRELEESAVEVSVASAEREWFGRCLLYALGLLLLECFLRFTRFRRFP